MDKVRQKQSGNATPNIYRSAVAHPPTASPLLDACEKALVALNTAPRFKVPALDAPGGKTDSYMIAGLLGRAIRRAKGEA